VLLLHLLVEMLHIEIEILFPVQVQHPLYRLQRYPLRTWFPTHSVVQSVVSELLVPLLHTSHLSRAYPDYFRLLPPRHTSCYRSQYDILYIQCPLNCGFRVVLQVTPTELLTLRLLKRTFHLLFRADISCATDSSTVRELPIKRPPWCKFTS